MRKIREYIEQRERDFAQLNCRLSVDREIQIIKELYQDARQNDENNDPSTYHSPAVPVARAGNSAENSMQSQLNPDIRTRTIVPPVNPGGEVKESKEKDVSSTGSRRDDVHVRLS